MPRTGSSRNAFSFLHAADLRLDTPMGGVRPLPPNVAGIVRDAPLGAFDALVDLALAREVAFVVLAGGLCESARQDIRNQHRLLEGLIRLDGARIPVLIALGPDDPRGTWLGIPAWPSNVTFFPDGDVEGLRVERDNELLAVVQGGSLDGLTDPVSVISGFRRSAEPRFHMGVLPAVSVTETPGAPGMAGKSALARLRAAKLDYWALGGEPAHRIVADRDSWVVVSGATQGRGGEAAHQGEKGALLVAVRDSVVQAPQLIPLDRVRMLDVEGDAGRHRELAQLAADLAARAERLRAGYAGSGLLVRAVVRGEGRLAATFRDPAVAEELLADLRDRAATEAPVLWWTSVVTATEPRHDLADLMSRTDLRGELVSLVNRLRVDQADGAALVESKTRALPSDRLRPWLPLDPRGGEALLEQAQMLALDALAEDGS